MDERAKAAIVNAAGCCVISLQFLSAAIAECHQGDIEHFSDRAAFWSSVAFKAATA